MPFCMCHSIGVKLAAFHYSGKDRGNVPKSALCTLYRGMPSMAFRQAGQANKGSEEIGLKSSSRRVLKPFGCDGR